jgi:hypothetical protein
MKTIDTFAGLSDIADEELRLHYSGEFLRVLGHGEASEADLEQVMINAPPFSEFAGGSLNIIETMEDLNEVSTPNMSNDGENWASIVEIASAFDMCEYILKGKHVSLMSAWNNAGGATYAIPRHIANKCDNVKLSVAMTAEAWNPSMKEKPQAEMFPEDVVSTLAAVGLEVSEVPVAEPVEPMNLTITDEVSEWPTDEGVQESEDDDQNNP